MTAAEAHQALLIRAYETPMAAPWTDADAAWASAEAARREGEHAPAERLIARRAQLAFDRLASRDPAIAAAGSLPTAHGAWAGLGVLLAFVFGLMLDAIGPGQRLNIVALPLLGLLAWNLGVYALLLLQALRGAKALPGSLWLQGRLEAWRASPSRRRAHTPALRRFLADALAASRPLQAHRLAFVLHAGAAAIAAGMLVSMYARGLALEYRAGWDSTFLNADGVHALLSVVLWPALTLLQEALPSAADLANLRFSIGPGENAAHWIHLLALNVAVLVLLPRGVLAWRSAWAARRWLKSVPLDLSEPYFQRLLRVRDDAPVAVQVLPYSYRLDAGLQPGLREVLEHAAGGRVQLTVADSLPVGSEDALADHLGPIDGAKPWRLPLFALTATPERETHGAFLQAVSAHERDRHADADADADADAEAQAQPQPGGAARLGFSALVDESGFRRQFDAQRLAQRRAAWQKLMTELGGRALFVDLSRPDLAAVDDALLQTAPALAHR